MVFLSVFFTTEKSILESTFEKCVLPFSGREWAHAAWDGAVLNLSSIFRFLSGFEGLHLVLEFCEEYKASFLSSYGSPG